MEIGTFHSACCSVRQWFFSSSADTTEDDGMSDEPKKRPRAWIGWTALVLFVLYPLSMGPVWWLDDHFGPWGSGIVSGPQFTAYAPLFWLGERFPSFGNALHWYVHLWSNIAD
jgi:hypothetical protein